MKCDKKIYSLDYNKTMFAVLVILLHFTFNEVLSIILQKVFLSLITLLLINIWVLKKKYKMLWVQIPLNPIFCELIYKELNLFQVLKGQTSSRLGI